MSKKRGRPRKQKAVEIETVNVDDAGYEVDAETSCYICYAEFIDPEDLQIHMNTVHKNQIISKNCEFCALLFKTEDELVIHIRDKHLTSSMLCSYCYRLFTDSNEFLVHKKLHLNNCKDRPYSCSNCKETFQYIKDVENHELKNHFNSESGVFLHKYFSLLSSYLNLNIVAFLQSLDSDTVYICVKCNFTNQSPEQYVKHLMKSKCRSCACDKCYNVYSKLKYLLQHVLSNKECMHSPSEEALIAKCPHCENDVRKEIFIEHKNTCKVIACKICKQNFDTMDMFAEHQTKFHPSSIEIFICKYCHKQYVGNTALQKHIDRVHQQELHLYRYTCNECDYSYKHPKLLFSHFFSKHPDLKPFTCQICDKSFKQRKKFTIHIKLQHNSQGNVRFGENSHVYFTDKSSEDNIVKNSENDNEKVEDNTEKQLREEDITENETASKMDMEVLKETLIKHTGPIEQSEVNFVEEPVLTSTEKPQENKRINKPFEKPKMKRKRKRIRYDYESDEEPLSKKMTKRAPRWNKLKNRVALKGKDKKDFTCPHCRKYCYTFQNYTRHMSLHARRVNLKCIKCDEKFKSETALKEHMSEKHSYSKLTETLKFVLEKRNKNPPPELKSTLNNEKFLKTIKKVNVTKSPESAVLTEVKTGLSKFIETFSPDVSKNNKKQIKISTNISIKTVDGAPKRPPVINMYKFKPPPPVNDKNRFKLAMPKRFKLTSNYVDHPSATIKVVTSDIVPKFSLKVSKIGDKDTPNTVEPPEHVEAVLPDYEIVVAINEDHAYDHPTETHHNEDDEQQQQAIPDVAEEVMLAASEDAPKQKFTHKLILPNIPAAFEGIRIGHLLPEAPYFKIVNVKELLDTDGGKDKEKEKEKECETEPEPVVLPHGTKLVNVNPLQHLIKDTSILLTDKNKNTKDYSSAVAKALMKLEQQQSERLKKVKVETKTTKPKEKKPKLEKIAERLRMFGFLEGQDGLPLKKKQVKKSKKSPKKSQRGEDTLLIVDNQETTEEPEMEVMEEYLEDLLSDEEVPETVKAPESDPQNYEAEYIEEGATPEGGGPKNCEAEYVQMEVTPENEGSKRVLSLPEL